MLWPKPNKSTKPVRNSSHQQFKAIWQKATSAKLAQEKGQSEVVKQFGAMLMNDHGEHKTKADQLANELGVKPPSGPSISQKATYAKLKMLSGASFDRSFATAMVKDHQHDIKEYQKEASKDDAAGKLAKETLPVLQKHLQTAQSLEKQSAEK